MVKNQNLHLVVDIGAKPPNYELGEPDDRVDAKYRVTSCDLGVFVQQAAKPVASGDRDVGVDRVGKCPQWAGLVQGPVRTVCRSNIGSCGLSWDYAAWWYSLITPAMTGLRRMVRRSVRSAASRVGSV
jgi:hypothetical protein